MKTKLKIIFIGYGILGDFIVCHRSMELLKKHYPDSHITYIGEEKKPHCDFFMVSLLIPTSKTIAFSTEETIQPE